MFAKEITSQRRSCPIHENLGWSRSNGFPARPNEAETTTMYNLANRKSESSLQHVQRAEILAFQDSILFQRHKFQHPGYLLNFIRRRFSRIGQLNL